jgi:hypothetical protein
MLVAVLNQHNFQAGRSVVRAMQFSHLVAEFARVVSGMQHRSSWLLVVVPPVRPVLERSTILLCDCAAGV